MRLDELLALRPFPGAGLLVTVTRRCPLRCSHCSTASLRDSEQVDAAPLRRFLGSLGPADRPGVVLLTGGEPLLRPDLCADLAGSAARAGSRVALLSGMFFARKRTVPARVMRAVTAVDHFSASLDAFHEREVARADVFRAVHQVLDAGVECSFHLTGLGGDDPYLADVVADVRREFDDQVPMLVNEVRSFGRAAAWIGATRTVPDATLPGPCAMAAWPVIAFDGTVVACCNQRTVDERPVPAHLRLGHIAEDDWPEVRRRALESPVLRLVRALGPAHLTRRYTGHAATTGYCDTCRGLADRPEVTAGAAREASGAGGLLLDRAAADRQCAAGPVELMRRHGVRRYAGLVALPDAAKEVR